MWFTPEEIEPCLIKEGNTLFVTLTNSGYLLYTLNLLKSLKPYGWDKKMLILCMDLHATTVLRERGYYAFLADEEDNTLSRFCPWNTKGYDKICYMKLRMIHEIVMMGKNVLLVDGDVVFCKDPMEDARKWWLGSDTYDVYVQNDSENDHDHTNLCTGYMWIRSTPQIQHLYDCISEEGQERYRLCAFDNNDQTYFNRHVKPDCRVCVLPLDKYPNGNVYMKRVHQVKDRCMMIHFNWLRGHFKLVKMKQYGKWLLTPEEEIGI